MLASLRPGGSETVALMLEKGADPKVKDGRGNTALGLAATIGEVETMRLLLAKGADAAPRITRASAQSFWPRRASARKQ
jgi:ankyrin repeat protein